jgi:hypothetical protein
LVIQGERQEEISREIFRLTTKKSKLRVSWLEILKSLEIDPNEAVVVDKNLILDYQEAVKAVSRLQQECGDIGHVSGDSVSNGLGTEWDECKYCGSRFNIKNV